MVIFMFFQKKKIKVPKKLHTSANRLSQFIQTQMTYFSLKEKK